MNYKPYIIFHKTIYETCYKDLSANNFDKLTFFGVNSKIKKMVPKSYMDKIIIERNLPYYNPLWQHSGFCEDSVFLHVYKNPEMLLNDYDYVGFFQYDMIMENSLFDTIDTMLKNHQEPYKLFFYYHKENSYRHLDQVICLQGWQIILSIYNQTFSTHHTMELLISNDIPLYHCYVLPKDIFNKMMMFFEKVFPIIFELLGCDSRHLPYHLERCHGMFLLFQHIENHLPHWIKLPGLTHSDSLKDPWQQIRDA